jgi:LAO/AO transport system kinase
LAATSLADLRAGGKPALARALAAIERAPASPATLDLLDAAWAAPRGHAVGLTGPPGVGKSTLASALVKGWRERAATVGVMAVDPSSRRTGGALLGDRARIEVDPEDTGVFVRSMAARDRLGGLAELCAASLVLMRAVFDIVLVETVGVGQSETEVKDLVDTLILAVQPASGDSLQYMKAGIAEVPDIAVVTKADLGALAEQARHDLALALRIAPGPPIEVLTVSANDGSGLPELLDAVAWHRASASSRDLEMRRRAQAQAWIERGVREELGRRGLAALHYQLILPAAGSPFRLLRTLTGKG